MRNRIASSLLIFALANAGNAACGMTYANATRLDALIKQGKLVEGRKLCEQLVAREPNDYYSNLQLALFTYWTEPKQGILKLKRVMERFPNEGAPRIHWANILIAHGKFTEARQYARTAGKLDPSEGSAFAIEGQCDAVLRDYNAALECAEKAEKAKHPSVGKPDEVRLAAFAGLGKLGAMRNVARQVDLNKLDWNFLNIVANELLARGEFDNALALAQLSPESNPAKAYLVSYGAAQKMDLPLAEKYAKTLWKRDPHNYESRFVMTELYQKLGMYPEAKTCLSYIDRKRFNTCKTTLSLAFKVHSAAQDYEQAIKDLNLAMAISNPIERAELLQKRADTYYLLGDYQQALADFTAAIKCNPRNGELYTKRAEIYEQLKDTKAAQADLKKGASLK